VRRLFRWAVGIASALAIWKAWTRRRPADTTPAAPPEPDPADELRRTLASSREKTEAMVVAQGDEPAGDGPEASLEERRARVHAKAQEAAAEMRGIEGDEP
jgi:hypothetical protein